MGRKHLLENKLQMVQGAVPSQVVAILRRMAAEEKRTLSAIVRRIIEESSPVKAALKNSKKQS